MAPCLALNFTRRSVYKLLREPFSNTPGLWPEYYFWWCPACPGKPAPRNACFMSTPLALHFTRRSTKKCLESPGNHFEHSWTLPCASFLVLSGLVWEACCQEFVFHEKRKSAKESSDAKGRHKKRKSPKGSSGAKGSHKKIRKIVQQFRIFQLWTDSSSIVQMNLNYVMKHSSGSE